jgi:hypothetical protein
MFAEPIGPVILCTSGKKKTPTGYLPAFVD